MQHSTSIVAYSDTARTRPVLIAPGTVCMFPADCRQSKRLLNVRTAHGVMFHQVSAWARLMVVSQDESGIAVVMCGRVVGAVHATRLDPCYTADAGGTIDHDHNLKRAV